MKAVRFVWSLSAAIALVLIGLLILALVFPFLGFPKRQAIQQRWSRCLLSICDVQTHYEGGPVIDRPLLMVLNHVSWLDIFVLGAVRPTAFVAKSEIRTWPVLGWLVAGAGTVFIERRQRHAIKHVATQMTTKFAQGQSVGLFPEGTTSDGMAVQDFYASLFEAAISTGVDIQPVALRFYDGAQRSSRVAFVGDQSLLQNMWLLLSQKGTRIECEFLPLITHAQSAEQGRVATAKQAQEAIRDAVSKGL